MAPLNTRLFLPLLLPPLMLLLLAGLPSQQVPAGRLLPNGALMLDADADDDQQAFVDASARHDDWELEDEDAGEDEMFYDAESDEIGFDEEAEENSCATASSYDCETCCTGQGFDLPFWNRTIGQCFCYVSHGEPHVCRDAATESPGACHECCLEHAYKEWDFPEHEETCYCSMPDYSVYFASLKASQQRAAR